MSVDLNINKYTYNSVELGNALAAKGLDAAKVEEVLREIDSGSLASLKALGLTGHVSSGMGGVLLPPAALDEAALSLGLDKLNQFNTLQIMFALHEAAKELKSANREARHAERDAAMNESMNAADKIRSSALTNLCFGVTMGAVNIGMGMFSIAMSGAQIGNMKSGAAAMTKAQQYAGMVQGLNTGAGGVAGAGKSVGDFIAAGQQAEQAEHTAAAQKHSSAENEASEYQKSFDDLLREARDILKEVLQGINQSNRSIYQNM
jgi:hypothetical protein